MTNTYIVSVAFREPYVTHQAKQLVRIWRNLKTQIQCLYFTDELPTKKGIITENIIGEFQKSLYGFKVHAVQKAIEYGCKKIIWLDPSVLPTASMQVLIDALDEHPMIVRSGENSIIKMANQKSKDWFGFTDAQLEGVKHVGGTVYGFNFNNQKAVEVFNLWKEAEENGIFGTQDEFMAGHWADEACMALAMHKIGVPQYWEEKFTYLNQKEL